MAVLMVTTPADIEGIPITDPAWYPPEGFDKHWQVPIGWELPAEPTEHEIGLTAIAEPAEPVERSRYHRAAPDTKSADRADRNAKDRARRLRRYHEVLARGEKWRGRIPRGA